MSSSETSVLRQTLRTALALGALTSAFLALLLLRLVPKAGLDGPWNLLTAAPFDPERALAALSSFDYGVSGVPSVDVARYKSALEADWVLLFLLPLTFFGAGVAGFWRAKPHRTRLKLGLGGLILLGLAIGVDWSENERLYGLVALAGTGRGLTPSAATALSAIALAKLALQTSLAAYALYFTYPAKDPFFFRHALLATAVLLLVWLPSSWVLAALVIAAVIYVKVVEFEHERREPPPKNRTVTEIQRESFFLRRCARLLSMGRTPILLWTALLLFPLSAVPGAPFRELLGGIFRDFSLAQIGMTSLLMWIDAFLLAIVTGVYFDSLERRWGMLLGRGSLADPKSSPTEPAQAAPSTPPPCRRDALTFPWALDEVSLPPKPNFLALCLLPWTAGTLLLFAERRKVGSIVDDVIALGSFMLIGLLLTGLCLWGVRCWKYRHPSIKLLTPLYQRYPEIFKDEDRLSAEHFIALLTTALFGVIFAVSAIFADGLTAVLPTSLLLLLGVGFVILVAVAAEFYLSRYDASLPLVLVAALVVLGLVVDADHYFSPITRVAPQPPPPSDRLTPEATVFAGDSENIILVSASGGGIAAAGWTTAAIHTLVSQRPASWREIRAISAVSGGAVGAAFMIDALSNGAPDTGVAALTRTAHEAATAESLDALAFGLVARDLFRPVLGRFILANNDRGNIQERAWAKIASAAWGDRAEALDCRSGDGRVTLGCLRDLVAAGRAPAPILNAVVLETGRRIMMTPIDFPGLPDMDEPERAYTFDEYFGRGLIPTSTSSLQEDQRVDVDLPLWSAARLSSVFPFVAPPARSDLGVAQQRALYPAPEHQPPAHWGHHLIDGGYYDNYGVASLVELLAAVDRSPHWKKRRLLVLRLEAFPRKDPARVDAVGSFFAKTLGPVVASANVSKESAAFTRNNGELHRMLDRLQQQEVTTCAVTLAPHCYDGPLSWKLTVPEKNELRRAWGLDLIKTGHNGGPPPPYPAKFQGRCSLEEDREALAETVRQVIRYLDGTGPCPGHHGTPELARAKASADGSNEARSTRS